LQALKTPNFVKQDFELEPESNLSFHLVNTNKTKQLFKGKTIPFGYSDSKPTTSLAEAIRDDYDPSKPNTSLAEAITGFCRPCNTVQESLDGKCMTCGEWVVVE
jgi:hypothetical protein